MNHFLLFVMEGDPKYISFSQSALVLLIAQITETLLEKVNWSMFLEKKAKSSFYKFKKSKNLKVFVLEWKGNLLLSSFKRFLLCVKSVISTVPILCLNLLWLSLPSSNQQGDIFQLGSIPAFIAYPRSVMNMWAWRDKCKFHLPTQKKLSLNCGGQCHGELK